MKNILILLTFFLATISLACSTMSGANISHDNYPDEWWKPVPESELASWEIGPQAADRLKNEVILSKRTTLGMLSNFYAASFTYEGIRYASIEGLWQSLKFPENAQDPRNSPLVTWPYTRAQVETMTAFDAKRAGDIASQNMKNLKINWVTFKGQRIDYKGKDQDLHYQLIFKATAQKVLQNNSVRDLLLSTGDLRLLPDHRQEANSPPAYAYYDIAMKIREALKNGQDPKP